MKNVYLAWQDAVSRAWFPVGRLSVVPRGYRFEYVRGFQEAGKHGLTPIIGFPEPYRVYEAEQLFPLFSNRLMSPAREDYGAYLDRLDVSNRGALSPEVVLTVLARSEGRRLTDAFEVFPFPLVEGPTGRRFAVHFFAHGLRHMPPAARERALQLSPGERLFLMADWQNPEDPEAMALRTADKHLIGYAPRYYANDLRALFTAPVPVELEVARTNPPPAPIQQRILCRLDAPWPFENQPLTGLAYESLAR